MRRLPAENHPAYPQRQPHEQEKMFGESRLSGLAQYRQSPGGGEMQGHGPNHEIARVDPLESCDIDAAQSERHPGNGESVPGPPVQTGAFAREQGREAGEQGDASGKNVKNQERGVFHPAVPCSWLIGFPGRDSSMIIAKLHRSLVRLHRVPPLTKCLRCVTVQGALRTRRTKFVMRTTSPWGPRP